jgi:[ribosomal protein S5]-alanine N-acetyltransferase
MSLPITLRPINASVRIDPAHVGEFAGAISAVASQAQVPPWCSFIAWLDGEAVGFCGFKSAPDTSGAVEIGYITFTPYRGRSIATALAAALVGLARSQGARSVTANTLPETNASTAVLTKNGFGRAGKGHDDKVGATWAWRLDIG